MNDNELSWGKIVDKNTMGNISLPKKMFDSFFKKSWTAAHVLIIFSPKPRALKIDIFPLEGSEVIKIQVKLTNFSVRTIEQLREVGKDLELPDYIFMSGVCVEQDMCVHESYIEKNRLTASFESVRERFLEVDSVTDVQIYNVE